MWNTEVVQVMNVVIIPKLSGNFHISYLQGHCERFVIESHYVILVFFIQGGVDVFQVIIRNTKEKIVGALALNFGWNKNMLTVWNVYG